MVKNHDLIKMRTTKHAYKLIQVYVTGQKGQIPNNIKNVRKYGISYPNKKLGDNISGFIAWVIHHYRTESKNPQYGQLYVIYSFYLYVFSPYKSKLITVYELPETCRAEAKAIVDKRKSYISPNKLSIYERPLTKVGDKPKKKRRRKKKSKNGSSITETSTLLN